MTQSDFTPKKCQHITKPKEEGAQNVDLEVGATKLGTPMQPCEFVLLYQSKDPIQGGE